MPEQALTPAGAAVHVTEITKSFSLAQGDRLIAVRSVSVTVASGSIVALTGPSGSGKSTLLHLIGAIERSDSGSIEVGGVDVQALSRRSLADYRRTVGFVFQRFNLLGALTALDNVVAPVLPYRTDFDKAARARGLLAAVGLEGREHAIPSRLSGGQQQRIAIARALINNPRLLLADEPTGNLDSHNGSNVLDLLLRLRDERGLTIIIATHDPQIAARCERLIRLRDGQIIDDAEIAADDALEDTLRRLRLG